MSKCLPGTLSLFFFSDENIYLSFSSSLVSTITSSTCVELHSLAAGDDGGGQSVALNWSTFSREGFRADTQSYLIQGGQPGALCL